MNLSDVVAAVALVVLVAGFIAGRVRLRISLAIVLLFGVFLLLAVRDAVINNVPLLGAGSGATWTEGSSIGAELLGPGAFLFRAFFALVAVFLLSNSLLSVGDNAFERVRRCLVAWVIGVGASAAVAVFVASTGTVLPFVFYSISADRFSGLANHPNSLGQSCAMAAIAAIYLCFGVRRSVPRCAFWIVVTVLIVSGAWISGSRAALIGLFSGIVLLTIWVLIHRRGWWRLTLVVLLAFPAGLVVLDMLTGTRFTDPESLLSNNARLAALERGYSIYGDHPVFGAELGIWFGEMVPLILLTSGGVILTAVYYGTFASYVLRVARVSRVFPVGVPLSVIGLIGLGLGLLNNGLLERYLYWPLAIGWGLVQIANRKRREGDL